MTDLITIDGSIGEGGGQIFRSALGLSMVTRKSFQINNIRARRKRPGLLHQHLTALKAAAQVGAAAVQGDSLGSLEVRFAPQGIHAGNYRFSVGTAGSCTLVLQTILPALMMAGQTSQLVIEGGTHNPFAPPIDFLTSSFLPILEAIGPQAEVALIRPGFYPAGGGRIEVSVAPSQSLAQRAFTVRGSVQKIHARALVARLPRTIAVRELNVLCEELSIGPNETDIREVTDARGPGNAVVVTVESDRITEVFTGFGQRGVRAEQVAARVAAEVKAYIDANVPVGPYLADQLLIPMALAGGGRFCTLAPTNHTRTNIEVIRRFLDVAIAVRQIDAQVWEVAIG